MKNLSASASKTQRSLRNVEVPRSESKLLKGGVSTKSISIGIHRPKKFQLSEEDFDLDKYADQALDQIYLDPRPRIKNIVKELEEEHQWTWPPQPPKDFEKARLMKRKKWPALYSQQCLDLCTFLSLIIGPWELLVAIGYMALPKTFVPAMRESSEFCILFSSIFVIEGFFHTYASLLGLGLRSMRPYTIGFVFPSWPFEFVLPLMGIFSVFIGFYTTQRWRILKEMTDHLKNYNHRWYSKSYWDRYQNMMHCCGIESYADWKDYGPVMESSNGNISMVPSSCCVEDNCWLNTTEANVHSMGCLEVTKMGTNTILASGTCCMLVAVFLSIMGHRSMREAEDFMGDPCHKLIFDTNSTNSMKTTNKASRRDELFCLLNQYSLQLGKELGFDREVKDVNDSMGIVKEEDEVKKIPSEPKTETQPPPPPPKDDEPPPPSPPGAESPDFLFDSSSPGSQGSMTDVPQEEANSDELSKTDHDKNLPETDQKETVDIEPDAPKESTDPEKSVPESENFLAELPIKDAEVLLSKQSSLMMSDSAMEFAIPPEDEELTSVTRLDGDGGDPDFMKKSSLVSLIPEVPSEVTRVDLLSPIQSQTVSRAISKIPQSNSSFGNSSSTSNQLLLPIGEEGKEDYDWSVSSTN